MLSAVSQSYAIWTHRICPSLSRTSAIRRLSAAQSQHEIQNQNHTDGPLRSMPVRYTREEDEMILKHRREGLTWDAITNIMQRGRGSVVSRFLTLTETKYPPKGLFGEAEDQLLLERRPSGYSFKDIASELQRAYNTVANRFYLIVAKRNIRHYIKERPRQASAQFSADDDSLIIRRKAEGATGSEIARELRMESPNAHSAVTSRWRKLQLRSLTPLPVNPRVSVPAELARRITESRVAGKSFREIAILEGSSIERVRGIFYAYSKKRISDGKRTALDDVLANAHAEQPHTPLDIKDLQQRADQQVAQAMQLPRSSIHGLHRRQKSADPHKSLRRWTPEQDEELLGFAMQNGHDRKALHLQMPDRTVTAIKLRYHKLMRDMAILAAQKL